MKILVCVKRVPDTSARIKPDADGTGVDLSRVEHVLSPYDEFAMEDALVLKETHGGEIHAVTIGPKEFDDPLRTCLALGADRASRVDDPEAWDSDSLGIARILAAIVERDAPDVVYVGKQATDGDFHAVGAALATLTNRPFVSACYPITVEGGRARAERPVEGGIAVADVPLPAVFSAEKSRGKEPRYANLKGIMMAKKKPIETPSLADLGVDAKTVGAAGRGVTLESVTAPPSRGEATVLEDVTPAEAAERLLTYLRDDAKVL